MRAILKSCLLFLSFILIFDAHAFGQDHGQPDSLIIGQVTADSGITEVLVPVYAVTDDSVAFFNLPLLTDAPLGGFHIESVSIVSNILSQWDDIYSDYIEDNQYLRSFGIWDTGGDDNPPLNTEYQRIHILDLNVVIDPGTPGQYVEISSTEDPVGGRILMGLVDGTTEYQPSFQPGLITYGNPTGIESDTPEMPDALSLSQNYPNPFNPQTSIRYSLPAESRVSLDIFNLLGQHIRNLISGNMEAGTHEVTWDSRDDFGAEVPSGVYFYVLTTSRGSLSAKMLLVR